MVIMLIGTLSVIAINRFDRDSFDSIAAAGELITAIRYAQEMSMTHTGEDIDADNATDYYQIQVSVTGYSITQRRSSDGVAVAINDPRSNSLGFTQSWSNITLNPAITIRFDGHGAPNIGSTQTITVTAGTDNRTITVEETTGFTR